METDIRESETINFVLSTDRVAAYSLISPTIEDTMSDEESSAPTVSEAKKSSSWDWLWPAIAAVVIVRLFGVVGGLVTFGAYYLLKPKLGDLGRRGSGWRHLRCCRHRTWGNVARMTPTPNTVALWYQTLDLASFSVLSLPDGRSHCEATGYPSTTL